MDPLEEAANRCDELRRRIRTLELEAEQHRTARRRLHERFRLLSSLTGEAVTVVDGGRFVDVSPEFEKLLGYTPEEAIGMSPLDITAPESRALAIQNIGRGFEEPYVIVGLRKDGSKPLLRVRGRAIEYRGRTGRHPRSPTNDEVTESLFSDDFSWDEGRASRRHRYLGEKSQETGETGMISGCFPFFPPSCPTPAK